LDYLKNRIYLNRYSIILLSFLFVACIKPAKIVIVPDNPVPPFKGVSELTVKNFINRAYIDLIGREPLDDELERDFFFLENRDLELSAIDTLLLRLQSDTTYREGDTSYRHAYSWQVYSQAKARMLDGEADRELVFDIWQLEQKYVKDSLLDNQLGMAFAKQEIINLQQVLDASIDFREARIQIHEVYKRMLINEIYDKINMGSFNFVNASFDDLFFRFPTASEFASCFDVIEYNISRKILGKNCQSKQEYAETLTESREFHEASIQAAFLTLLGRKATTDELFPLLSEFYQDHDYARIQREIMKNPEYGGF